MNLSVKKVCEVSQWHSAPAFLLAAFQTGEKFVLHRERTEEVSVLSVLCDTFIWFPLGFMLFLGSMVMCGVVLVLVAASSLFSWPISALQTVVSPAGLAVAYLLSLLCVFKTHTPLKDFRERKEQFGAKEIYLDFQNKVLVIGESYKNFPARDKTICIKLEKVSVFIDKRYEKDRGEDFDDVMLLKMHVPGLSSGHWACHLVDLYSLCSVEFDRRLDGREEEVEHLLNEIAETFRRRALASVA